MKCNILSGERQTRPRALGIAGEQLTALLSSIALPGFTLSHEETRWLVESPSGGIKSSVEQQWGRAGKIDVRTKIEVFDTVSNTAAGFAYLVFHSSGLAHPRTPKGFVFGEHCAVNSTGSLVLFCTGRVTVNVLATPYNHPEAITVVEGVAYGLDCALRRSNLQLGQKRGENIELSGPGVRERITIGQAGIALAPLAILNKMGVTVRSEPNRTALTISLGKRSVKLRPFYTQAVLHTLISPAKTLQMKAPVFLYKGQPIIPVESVATALGMRVERSAPGKTSSLTLTLPKG